MSFIERTGWLISDIIMMTKRNLIHYKRRPSLIVFSTIQPVMFVLLFTFVFGGAIVGDQSVYINYLLPGIFIQTVLFGGSQTTVGLTEDLSSGMLDRFRSLPMSRSSLLVGRTLADSVRNLFVVFLMIGVGFLIGFRFTNGFWNAVAAVTLVMLFGYAFTWIFALIGLMVTDVETAQVASFIWLFPLVFLSSVFVPTETMPKWLAVIADHQPITVVTNAVRELAIGSSLETGSGSLSLADGNPLLAFVWMIGICLVFIPLSVRKYRRLG